MGQWALSGERPRGEGGVACMKMTFKHFRGRTEGLIINEAELLLRQGGDGCAEVWGREPCASKLSLRTQRDFRGRKKKESRRIVHKARGFPHCPTPSHPFSILLL